MFLLDTNILMSAEDLDKMMESFHGDVAISLETLEELDKLKTAPELPGYRARRAVKYINKNWELFTFLKKSDRFYGKVDRKVTSMDDIIISYMKETSLSSGVLVTNDVSMMLKAKLAGVKVIQYIEKEERRAGVTVVEMTDKEFSDFSINRKNTFGLKTGEYLVVRNFNFNADTRVILKYNTDDDWDVLDKKNEIKNHLFSVKPKDDFQKCAIDSLMNDDLTVITGPAGTGKTLLCLGYALSSIKEGSKVHIFVNPVKTRGSEELGFYPGDRNSKLLQNFIGDILKNKMGDEVEVENLLNSGVLNIYPMSDIRGIEIPSGDIMYITEAQNLSIDLIKLAVQRPAEGSKIIIEGDPYTQVDKNYFAGELNGLRRLIEVYSGTENFAHVFLPNIYRSKIAEKAELL